MEEFEDDEVESNFDPNDTEEDIDDDFDPNDTEEDIEDNFDPNDTEEDIDDDFDPNDTEEDIEDDFDPNDTEEDIKDDFDPNDTEEDIDDDFDPNDTEEDEFDDKFNPSEEAQYHNENIGSQSTSTVLTNKIEEIESNVEHQEQEEEIEIHSEEYQDDTEPIVNTDEIEFIKDVEELAEHAREIKAEDENIEPQTEKENAAYYAEQYYETLKEKEVENDQDSKEEQETEELRQEVAEELNGDQESGYMRDELEDEDIIEASKITSTEEFEYLWEIREKLDREGKTSEEIEEVMHEAEEMYETFKEAEKIYEEEQQEKLKLVDHEDEASEEDLKEDLDRVDLIEQAVELEEELVQQGESQEEIDVMVEESIETTKFEEELEIIIEEHEKEKLKLVDHEDEASEEDLKEDLDRVDLIEQAIELEEELVQQGELQEEIDVMVEEALEEKEVETYENVEDIEIEVLKPELDAIESKSEDNKDLLEEDTKIGSEESNEEENERLQELYRQETNRRPIYARKKTNGYSQWLEQRELGSEKIKNSKSESEKIKEIKEEDWKITLKQWIREASEEECNAELKSELKKALDESYNKFEDLTRKFMELFEKSQCEKLSEKEKYILKFLTERLQKLDPIQLELLASVFFIKNYIMEQYWHDFWNRPLVNRVLSKFFKHISQKYKNLKKAQENKENSEEIIRNWIEQVPEEEISPEMKALLKEIVENYSELEELAIRFMELYKKEQFEQISQSEKVELKSLIKTLEKLDPINIVLFANIRAIKCYLNDQHLDDFSNKTRVNRVLNRFFKHISQKYKELRKEQKNEKIKYLISEDFKYVDQDINQNEKPISMTQEKATFFKSNDSTPPIKDLDATSDSPKVNKKDTRSPMGRQIVQNKKNRLKQIIIEQLQHYSQTGERLYTLEEAQAKLGYFAQAIRRNGKVVLEKIFNDPESASLIYSMILGGITTSYQKTKEDCIDNGLILITTPTQWFDMMKNRGDKSPSHLHVEVQCTKPEGHKNSVLISRIQGCIECSIGRNLNKPLGFQEVLKLASKRSIQAISFFDDSKPLTEGEFNELIRVHKAQHQDSDDYKSKTLVHINLRWKCKECGHVFERVYDNIKRSKTKHYCPSCVSSVDQQITLEKTEEAFQGYIAQPIESNVQLARFLPNRILLMSKYQVLSHGNVHIDIKCIISVARKEFKIAIEHQGIQHYSLKAYINLARGQDIKRGIYKTDAEYEIMFDAQIERDRAKVQLLRDLNKYGYYLIVVPYFVSPAKRISFILQKFIEQTDVNPGQPSIADYL